MSAHVKILRGPKGLTLTLNKSEVFPDDPGSGTPALVQLGNSAATYWSACGEGELNDGTPLSDAQQRWLSEQENFVEAFLFGS
jgi:hypothetical protein